MDAYIPQVLMRDLAGHERHPSAFLLYFYLWWRTHSQDRTTVSLSLQDLSDAIGLAKRTLQYARRLLLRRKLITMSRAGRTDTPSYRVLRPWRR